MLDLRSDTVTKPTPGMLDAMQSAAVGDDVFGEDPTVLALEDKSAKLFGKEAGLFCPSGTMSNQIAIKTLSNPPGELICDVRSHVYQYEGGGIAFNSGLSTKLLNEDLGLLSVKALKESVNPDDVHKAESQILSVENTCNKGGGSCYAMDDLVEMKSFCDSFQLKYHMDGARIFNALVAKGGQSQEMGKLFDTVSICLSKGLGAPVGSVLLGDQQTILKAKRIRKILGGGMRQAGYLAAAGIYALDNHIDRLSDDHKLATSIADILKEHSFVQTVWPVFTNIVVFDLPQSIETGEFVTKLKDACVLAVPFGGNAVRLVTHLDVSENDLNKLQEALVQVARTIRI